MTKDELIEELEASRIAILVAIEQLPDEALVQPDAVGSRSVADFLALQAAWESELVTGLLKLNKGKKPSRLMDALKKSNSYAQERTLENRGRSLDAIFDDWQGARTHLENWLAEFSDKDLTNPKRFKPLKGQALGKIIARVSFEQEQAYADKLAEYAKRWEAVN